MLKYVKYAIYKFYTICMFVMYFFHHKYLCNRGPIADNR